MTTYIALESRRYSNTFLLYKEDLAGRLKLIGIWFLPAELRVNVDNYIIIDEIVIWFYCIEKKE